MALISCPECNKEVSDRCDVCPHCGYPLTKKAPEKLKGSVMSKEKPGLMDSLRKNIFSKKIGSITISLNVFGTIAVVMLACNLILMMADLAYYRVVFEISTSNISQILPHSYYYAVYEFWAPLSMITVLACIASIVAQFIDEGQRRVKTVVSVIYTIVVFVGIIGASKVNDISSNNKNCAIFIRRKAAYVILLFAILTSAFAIVDIIGSGLKKTKDPAEMSK